MDKGVVKVKCLAALEFTGNEQVGVKAIGHLNDTQFGDTLVGGNVEVL